MVPRPFPTIDLANGQKWSGGSTVLTVLTVAPFCTISEHPFGKLSEIVTAVVQSSSQYGIYVLCGKKNLSILIKKNQLAKELENQRPSRFVKGDKLDAMITELDNEKRKVSLSIKALEEKQTKEAVKKYGSKDSGGVLGEILGPLLKKKTKDKK